MADAVSCAEAGQTLPQNDDHLELMGTVMALKSETSLGSSCMDAGGNRDDELVESASCGPLDELAERKLAADLDTDPCVYPSSSQR